MRNRSFLGWGKKLEKLLIRLVILCAVVLVVAQSIVVKDPMHRVIGYVNLEDVITSPAANQQLVAGEPTITLYLKDYYSLPKMYVLVNGETVGQFSDRYVSFQVHDGDLIQLDATFYDYPVKVQVLTTSEEIIYPPEDKTVKITGISSLGEVKIDKSK